MSDPVRPNACQRRSVRKLLVVAPDRMVWSCSLYRDHERSRPPPTVDGELDAQIGVEAARRQRTGPREPPDQICLALPFLLGQPIVPTRDLPAQRLCLFGERGDFSVGPVCLPSAARIAIGRASDLVRFVLPGEGGGMREREGRRRGLRDASPSSRSLSV